MDHSYVAKKVLIGPPPSITFTGSIEEQINKTKTDGLKKKKKVFMIARQQERRPLLSLRRRKSGYPFLMRPIQYPHPSQLVSFRLTFPI